MTTSEFHALREQLGLTQAALAEQLGITQSAVSQIESGAVSVSRRTAILVARLVKPKRKTKTSGRSLLLIGILLGNSCKSPDPSPTPRQAEQQMCPDRTQPGGGYPNSNKNLSTHTLRILTANIYNYAEPYQRRMELLRTQIRALDPDLIAFQEAGYRPGEPHQVEQLLSGMGYHLAHEAEGSEVTEERPYDVAVASRWPLGRRVVRELPGSGKVLAVEVLTPEGCLLLVSTIGTARWQFDREIERERDAVALDELLRQLGNPSGFPPIVAGDFDATPEAASIRFLSGQQSLDGRSTHWVDAWEAAGEGPGHTWSTRNDYARQTTQRVWHQAEQHRRIDYVFLGSPHHYERFAGVVSARVVLDEPSGTDWPSDHFGLLVEVAMARAD